MRNRITKKEMTEEIFLKRFSGIYEQVNWIYQAKKALSSLYYVYEHDKERFIKSKNFFYITRIALAEFYILELYKLLSEKEELNIRSVLGHCKSFPHLFNSSFEYHGKVIHDFDAMLYCKNFRKHIKNYQSVIENLTSRRNTTLAHNEATYFHFDALSIQQFPLDNEQLDAIITEIYNGLAVLCASATFEIVPKTPTNVDDLKRLFGLETDSDIAIRKILGSGD